MRVKDRGYFCEDVVMCDVLCNSEIILRVRKFGRRI